MRKAFAAFLGVLVPFCAFAQTALWEDTVPNSIAAPARQSSPGSYRTLRLNREALATLLVRAPMEFTAAAKSSVVEMTIPMPNGTFARFRIEESPISLPDPSGKISDFKAYTGQGIDDPTASMRFDISPAGFHAQILSSGETVYIDPFAMNDQVNCISYFKRDFHRSGERPACFAAEQLRSQVAAAARQRNQAPIVDTANGSTLRSVRTAIACTAEYTDFFRLAGDTDAQAKARALTAIKVTMNRVNGIWGRDVAVRYLLLADATELQIIYTNPATDPYTNDDASLLSDENQANLDAVITDPNYDIGHVFATSPGGEGTQGVCETGNKARGVTGTEAPVGDPFDVDFVAHEIIHQWGGNHTFNESASDQCNADNRNGPTAVEPGSGSTAASYAGICGAANLQASSHDYFHSVSIGEILNALATNAACATSTASGNTPPTVTAPASFTIPKNTPFTLTATASDANGDALTYAWEEVDIGAASPPNTDNGNRPLFRPYKPVTSRSRTFPSLTYILKNANNPPASFTGTSATGAVCAVGETCFTGEVMPVTTRTMKFRVTVRDNRAGGGGINDALTTVNVRADSGPFAVTSPNTAVTAAGGSPMTVTWNVANTTAAPVSAANVKISLSTNGGISFPTVLAASTPNDGSQAVTLPNGASTTARIKVEAVGNIFFDISNVNFAIQGGTGSTGAAGRGDFDGNGSLDYVLYDSNTRRTAIWYLNGSAFLSGAFGPTLPSGWTLACVADVNLDSNPDFVLSNAGTRRTAIWFLNNNLFASSAFGPTLPAGWTLNATADINRDGRPDYVLYNASTRQTAIWFLNGTALLSSAFGPTLPAGWRLSDALDFNADGNDDYVLTNSSTRQTAVWYLNGTSRTSSAFGPTYPSGWTLEGAGDFNANGKPDYVLFETSTRRTALWYLNGAVFSSGTFAPTIAAGYILASP